MDPELEMDEGFKIGWFPQTPNPYEDDEPDDFRVKLHSKQYKYNPGVQDESE